MATAAAAPVGSSGAAEAEAPPALLQASGRQVAERLRPFKATVFTEMTALANEHGAINLGQGFPNFDGPDYIKQAAADAMFGGKNQYAAGTGVPALAEAVAARFEQDSGLPITAAAHVTITSGATEAIAAAMLGLVNPGDEVILFAPFYDSYWASAAMAGAVIKPVTLRPPDFAIPVEELLAAFSTKTALILVNTPHNPTGKVYSMAELELIASLCKEKGAVVLSDEVYHKLVYAGRHVSMATLPGMFDRTLTVNSLGKTYSLTGWKVGWAIGPPDLTLGLRQAHSFMTFSIATPLQWGAVAALRSPTSYYTELLEQYSERRQVLVDGLKSVGFTVYEPQGSFFVMADHTSFGYEDDVAFCRHLVREVGVAAIPPSTFYADPHEGRKLVRFAFCKDVNTIRQAVQLMQDRLRHKQGKGSVTQITI
eukprot:SM000160S02547  [mRNA]  locus=s160:280671:283615:+ [translate_table: standard]